MSKITSYKDLQVWQKSMLLVREIYAMTQGLPRSELYNLTTQMRRSAISIPSNIAEGYRRRNIKEYIQFLSVALASAAELETQLIIVRDVYERDYKNADQLLEEIQKMLYSMIKKLNPQPSTLNPRAGFTLLETTIVIAITAALSAIAFSYNRSTERQIVLYRDQAIIIGLLNRAKAFALEKFNKADACAFGVYFNKMGGAREFVFFQDLKPAGEPQCKKADGSYASNMRYDGTGTGEAIQEFTLDQRLKFAGITDGDGTSLNRVNILFIPPELVTISTGGVGSGDVSRVPFSITISLATNDDKFPTSLNIGKAGQIVEQ